MMTSLRLTVWLGVCAAAVGVRADTGEHERNAWPLVVREVDAAGNTQQWSAAGPLAFHQPAENGTLGGVRPFWVQARDEQGRFRAGYFLYPLFSYRRDENTYQWNLFELIRRTDRRASAGAATSRFEPRGELEIWPFWFSRQTGDPELSYRGLFPVAGTVKNKLGFERASWVLFPLYAQSEKRGAVTTSVPWPFVRVTRGTAHGFGLWPLFETRERPGEWRREYYLWPLGYNNTMYPAPDAPAGTAPRRDIGALPFYARRTQAGYIDESYLWPFFGYTDRRTPVPYHETRYLWPFLVQGRGDSHYVNRWGPVYTHSVVNGYDKTWYAWPLVRHATWSDRGLALEKTQLLYFLYWSERQRSATHPEIPSASLTHVWPILSRWDNGAGRRQWQFFSPLEVFFPGNEKVRAAWTPLFALARHEQTAAGESRTALLWNFIGWEQRDAERAREFHLGPIFSSSSRAEEKRLAIGNGLLGWRRDVDGRWRMFWWDFTSSRRQISANTPRR
jgi:hypothetical protein